MLAVDQDDIKQQLCAKVFFVIKISLPVFLKRWNCCEIRNVWSLPFRGINHNEKGLQHVKTLLDVK